MSKVYNQTLLDEVVRQQSLPMSQVKQAANEILAIIREGLIRDGVVNVSNFGTFRLKPVAERKGINPQTRETIIIRAHHRVIFSPCKALRELIQPVHQPPIPLVEEDKPNQTLKYEPAAVNSPPGQEKQTAAETSLEQEQIEATPFAEKEPGTSPLIPPKIEAVLESPIDSSGSQTATVSPTETEEFQKLSPVTVIDTPAEGNSQPRENLTPTPDIDVTAESNSQPRRLPTFAMEEDLPQPTQDQSFSGRHYRRGAAIVLIALVCSGLFYEFGINRELPPPPVNESSKLTDTSRLASAEQMPKSASPDNHPVISPESPISDSKMAEATTGGTAVAEETQRATAPDKFVKVVSANDTATSVTEKETAQPPSSPSISADTAKTESSATIFFSEKEHMIVHGENLWRLAKHYYHEPLLWPHIYQANATSITNPDHLIEGSSIVIPTLQGSPQKLSRRDRRNLAEGYYLTYLYYKKTGVKEAFFALLEAKRYDSSVVEKHQNQLHLSMVEKVMLQQQPTMPF